MNLTALLIAALIVLPAFGLVAWAWFTLARVDGELRSFCGFEAMHFEIGSQATKSSERARWPIPG